MNKENRRAAMLALRTQGNTLQAIGAKFGVSRERVRQIIENKPSQRKTAIIITNRQTCFVCQAKLQPTRGEFKFCLKCKATNAIDKGRDRVRGIVRGRDANTCQSCGKLWQKGRRFDVHHLNGECGLKSRSYDALSQMHLLITVCHKCHYNLHDHHYNNHAGEKHGVHI